MPKLQVIGNVVIGAALYASVAMSFAVGYLPNRFFNLSLGTGLLVGGYTAFVLQEFARSSLLVAALGAALTGALLGGVLQSFLFEPFQRRRAASLQLLVVSFGVLVMGKGLAAMAATNRVRTLARTSLPIFEIGSVRLTSYQVLTIACVCLALIVTEMALRMSRRGRYMRAIGDDPLLAQQIGVPVRLACLTGAVVSFAMVGLAGVAWGVEAGVTPDLGMAAVLKGMVASILGGLASPYRAVLGALVLATAEAAVVHVLGSAWKDLAAYTLLFLFIAWRPKGLFSRQSEGVGSFAGLRL